MAAASVRVAQVGQPGEADPEHVVVNDAVPHGIDQDGQRQDVVEAAGVQQPFVDARRPLADRLRAHGGHEVAQQPDAVQPVQLVQVHDGFALQTRVAHCPQTGHQVRRVGLALDRRVDDGHVLRLGEREHANRGRGRSRTTVQQREQRRPHARPVHFRMARGQRRPVGFGSKSSRFVVISASRSPMTVLELPL